ncbi:glutathione S-transferase T1 isoform X2 [Beta vulgaris subsp. vulgaris]|uniref:glutathione S-transferase T1 isoform X2 n=1 Tax=Beta vulgaris subsp. vulgaris TaxID=3555 RepID=UPI002547C962|nr:glutathione S-transferase T1 isoform X2 [Beta vulgaris subsp. vulgaris]
MTLKVFADRMSQPSRAVILFCKLNKINFEEVRIDLFKRQHFSQEFAEINPLRQVPAIVDGRFKLYERYPADVSKRAKIHSVLDWHHLNLRYGAMRYVVNTTLGPALGRPLDSQAAARAEKVLDSSLATIESVWLEGSGKFLLGSKSPSIADLSLVCEIMQLEVLDEKDRARILNPYKKVRAWIEATKVATHPHFDDVHGVLFRAKAKFQKQRERDLTAASSNARLHSKM